jgi:hypothetical protein
MRCDSCGKEYEIGDWIFCPHGAVREKRPFKGWIDEHISSDGPVEITSLAQWNRLMKENNSDLKDKLSQGEMSARRDKREWMKKERQHAS